LVGSMFSTIAAWFKTVFAAFGMGQDPLDKEIDEARAAFKSAMGAREAPDATDPE